MLKKERQAFILHQVNLHNKVMSSNLSRDMNVSEDTIRRDLQELADEAFADLLRKHRRPVTLKEALRASVRSQPANDGSPRQKRGAQLRRKAD